MTEIYNEKLFMCQFFEYVIEQQFSTIEQIRESIIVRGGWEDQNDTEENSNKIQENTILHTGNNSSLIKGMFEKVTYDKINQSQPDNLNSAQQNNTNHFDNPIHTKNTWNSETIKINNKMSYQILSVEEEFDLIKAHSPIMSPASLSGPKFEDLEDIDDTYDII